MKEPSDLDKISFLLSRIPDMEFEGIISVTHPYGRGPTMTLDVEDLVKWLEIAKREIEGGDQ